jgi:lipopolysaccharide transport system ATP-binding protein
MTPIITVKNISKKYNINHQQGGYITLRDIMTNAFKNPLKFLKRKTKNILGLETKEEFWALKDVNFEVMKGEVIGIIGRNGAGKSTLLKILSQITPPTTGEIRINGTVGSLLEVGTGFHPELTGRENIFLNGAILGMKKKEIVKKFDEIVKFADIEKFLDTPVKYYSSGMYVRLAFSVAAHMDTDILIIDEVLAVGDAEFQKKCLGKMEDITQKEGRTILFVSHNMGAIQSLCKKTILLEKGNITMIGSTESVVSYYLTDQTVNGITNNYWEFKDAPGKEKIKVKSAYIQYKGDQLTINTPFDIVTEFWCLEDNFPVNVSMSLYDTNDICVYNLSTKNEPLKKGLHQTIFHIPANLMNDGIYYINNMFVSNAQSYFYQEKAHSFEIIEDREISISNGKWFGVIRPTFIKQDYNFIESI